MKQEKFSLAGTNNRKIIGDITYSTKPTQHIALFVHGFKGFKDWGAHNLVAKYFASQGIGYAKFNFSHSGVNPDNPVDVNDMELFASNTPTKELYDLDVVISYIKQEFPNAKLSLIGHSRGGGLSILQAYADDRIDKLITWAAIDAFNSLWKKEQEQEWRANGKIEVYNARTKEYMPLNVELLEDVEQNKEKLNIVEAAKKLSKPWLIIHGDDDVNVKISVARDFKAVNNRAQLFEVEDTNHVFGASHPYNKTELPKALEKVCKASLDFVLEA